MLQKFIRVSYEFRLMNFCTRTIDIPTNKIIATVPVGSGPEGVVITPNGKKVYVTNGDDGTISVIDTETNAVTAMVHVEDKPQGVAVSPDGTKVYVTNWQSNNVSEIDTATNKVIASVESILKCRIKT